MLVNIYWIETEFFQQLWRFLHLGLEMYVNSNSCFSNIINDFHLISYSCRNHSQNANIHIMQNLVSCWTSN